jgi:hypothetical protein
MARVLLDALERGDAAAALAAYERVSGVLVNAARELRKSGNQSHKTHL